MAERKRRIRYAGLNMPGTRVLWRENEDNPLSPLFVPLTERDDRGKARWWAHMARRARAATGQAVFDEDEENAKNANLS